MRLILTQDDGTVEERWHVETNFGDISKHLARAGMAMDIAEAVARAEKAKLEEDKAKAEEQGGQGK